MRITMPPFNDGCASRVPTACLTFRKGRPWCAQLNTLSRQDIARFTYDEFCRDGILARDGRRLKGQHGVCALHQTVSPVSPEGPTSSHT